MEEKIKVSELLEADDINLEDLLMIIQDSTNKKVTFTKIKEFLKQKINFKEQYITISSGTTISNGYEINLQNSYVVGSNCLEIYWNGILLKKATSTENGHYKEVGNTGSSSNKIEFYRTTDDGSYTLQESAILTAIVRDIS